MDANANIQTSEDSPKNAIENYFTNRVDHQINYYNSKSSSYKKWHYTCQTVVIVCGALIPVFIGFADRWDYFKYVAALLGVAVTVAGSLATLKNYKDLWLSYRSTTEALTREKLLFENQIGATIGEDYDFKTFVFSFEQILSGEQSDWKTRLEKKQINDNSNASN